MSELELVLKALNDLTVLGQTLTLKKNGQSRQAKMLKFQHMLKKR